MTRITSAAGLALPAFRKRSTALGLLVCAVAGGQNVKPITDQNYRVFHGNGSPASVDDRRSASSHGAGRRFRLTKANGARRFMFTIEVITRSSIPWLHSPTAARTPPRLKPQRDFQSHVNLPAFSR